MNTSEIENATDEIEAALDRDIAPHTAFKAELAQFSDDDQSTITEYLDTHKRALADVADMDEEEAQGEADLTESWLSACGLNRATDLRAVVAQSLLHALWNRLDELHSDAYMRKIGISGY